MSKTKVIQQAKTKLAVHTDACLSRVIEDVDAQQEMLKDMKHFGKGNDFEEPPYE